jgi:glycine/D-amino acid oxidase-like deaminating enzyme
MLLFNQLSYWEKQTYINHTDFLIIGSGIVGLSSAIQLKERFPYKKVTILEQGFLPTGASSKNAGFSCIGSPSELLDDLRNNSEDEVFKTVEKRWKGLLNLRSLLGDNNIDYQSNGAYELFQDNSFEESLNNLDYLNQELEKITSLKNVFEVNATIIENSGFNNFSHAISHKAEGQIDTGKMINSLYKLAIEKDVMILNGISAEEIINKNELQTDKGKIDFKSLLICTNGFAKQFLPQEDIFPARAQVIITRPIEGLKFKGIYHFNEGFYYFRNIENRVLFGGGRQLDKNGETTIEFKNTDLIINNLKDQLKDNILPLTPFEIDHSWSGIMGIGNKKSPIVKQVSENIYCGVRLGGMGVAIGSLVGKELANLIE